MLYPILIALGVLIAGLLIFVATRPADFRITRFATIAAPSSAVFAQVNELRKWEAWSPWAKLDPSMKQTFEGPAAGVGAVSTWSGDKKVGAGRMTILESNPDDLVRIKLEFFRPFKATNMAEFTFKPQGEQTLVTWTMTGEKNFMAKAFHLLVNMDKLVGGDFEKGLAQMKSIAESAGR